MSEYSSPLGPMFELQRETIKRSVDVLQVPREARTELVSEGIELSEQLGQQSLRLNQDALQRSLELASGGSEHSLDEPAEALFETVIAAHKSLHEGAADRHEQLNTELSTRLLEEVVVLLSLSERTQERTAAGFDDLEQCLTQPAELTNEAEQQLDSLAGLLPTATQDS